MSCFWPLSKTLLKAILADKITDSFVAHLVWERLGYMPYSSEDNRTWIAGPETPSDWRESFPKAPQVIANRKASVHLTRSIPREYKQLLKQELGFKGYRIGDLYPRRTRRATVVNWLLAWILIHEENLMENGEIPVLRIPPDNPMYGHPGDPEVN